MVNYHAGSLVALPAPGRQIFGYPPAYGSRTTLTWSPPCRLYLSPLPCRPFLVASSLSPHLARFIAFPVGCPCFYLRGSVDLAVDLAIRWSAALPSSAARPSCRRSSYRRSSHCRSSHCGSGLSESDYCESSYCKLTHRKSIYCGMSH